LCVSELATNSCLHSDSSRAGGTFTVRAEVRPGDYAWIEVEDAGGPWQKNSHGDGRPHGLDIVDALASGWGIDGGPATGWIVWARFELPPASPGEPGRRTHQIQVAAAACPPAAHPQRHPGGTAMTNPAAATAQYTGPDMRAMADELAAHGLTTQLTDARAGLDLTAVKGPSGQRGAELIIDEEGYAELRYWVPPGTPPAEVTATALRALDVITGTAPDPGRAPQ
jgi:hypothetical protein